MFGVGWGLGGEGREGCPLATREFGGRRLGYINGRSEGCIGMADMRTEDDLHGVVF